MLYGAAVWDPALIISQIVTIQCLFYLTMGLCSGLLLGTSVSRLTVACLFSWKAYSFSTYLGWVSIASALVASALGAVFLLWIVERAKKCLDFASTCYIFHFCFSWRYDGFPTRFEWWAVNVVCLVIMSLFGEWLCLRREMQEIPLSERLGALASWPALRAGAAGGGGGGGSSGGAGAATSSSGWGWAMAAGAMAWLQASSLGTATARYRDSRLLRPFAAMHTVLKR